MAHDSSGPTWWGWVTLLAPIVILQVGNIIVSIINRNKVAALHEAVNGRTEQLLHSSTELAYARGVEAGRGMVRHGDKA
jgi:hypothetical protein